MGLEASGGQEPQHKPYRILLVHGPRNPLKSVAQVLRSVASEVDLRAGLEEVPPDLSYDLLLADYDALNAQEREHLLSSFSNLQRDMRLLLLSSGQIQQDFATLFGRRTLTNLVARNQSIDEWELLITVQKLLRRDIFGIEKYFAWGVTPQTIRVSRSSEKAAVVEEARKFARGMEVHPRLVDMFCNVADELVTNAIYNAPVDAFGKTRYSHVSREVEVALEPGESIEVKLSCDGRRLGISVADPFGSLTREKLLDYLSKCFRGADDQVDQKPGGAGVGFYYTFECLTHLVVNISPGKATELIGLIDVRGSYKDFASMNKSFNIFMSK